MSTVPPSAGDAALGAALQIRYDGRHYHYRGYRYENFADAERYARQQQSQPGYSPDPAFIPNWQSQRAPSLQERQLMAQHGILQENSRFAVGEYRYDSLDDAVAYVRLMARRRETA